ncbi:carbohydrate ABC transporter permease [Phormidium yuhuli AB48]|uniref:Carbohydrate ABC transporter permease n=2 Tax=Phormidium TaxID=1198 RepID=A0ABY5AYG4_9CYAN|nr:carbohydrate ABC transporter permease [Phormidium yuhuli]USR93108.1 carbohydrate ABC transporter permease [Phormidium yuhuli AB48]
MMLFPLVIVLRAAFAPAGSLANLDWGGVWTAQSYREAWIRGHFWLAFANSSLVAVGVTLIQTLTAALAGYALARFQFWGRKTILVLILATLAIPFQLLVIPIFLVLKWGNLLNTYGALILPTAVSGFGIFLMRQYFLTIPVAIEQAAILDGATAGQVLRHIMIPLSRPAWVTLFLFAFIGEWNDLFKPLVFTTRPELRTVQLTLAEFQEQFTSDWAVLMAAVVISSLPVIVLFLLGQRQFVQGIAATGVKE